MKERNSSNFVIGFLIGALICVLIWYWQKSTTADEGALDLLDKLAQAEKRIRQLQAELTTAAGQRLQAIYPGATEIPTGATAVDLQTVHGIGPTYADRLHQAGIQTIDRLLATNVETVAEILGCSVARAQTILAEAKSL